MEGIQTKVFTLYFSIVFHTLTGAVYILLDINKLHTLEDDTTRIKKCKEENDKPDENREECSKKYITLKTIKIDANTSYEKKKYILLKE